MNLTPEEQEALERAQLWLSRLEAQLLGRRKKRQGAIDAANTNVNLGLCSAAAAVLERIG